MQDANESDQIIDTDGVYDEDIDTDQIYLRLYRRYTTGDYIHNYSRKLIGN